jgi:hypothetical protein
MRGVLLFALNFNLGRLNASKPVVSWQKFQELNDRGIHRMLTNGGSRRR